MTNVEQAIKDLQDTLVVISEIERRQSALLSEHSKRMVEIEHNMQRLAESAIETREFQKHSDERLNALIHIVDDLVRKRPPQ
jgi:galactokinase